MCKGYDEKRENDRLLIQSISKCERCKKYCNSAILDEIVPCKIQATMHYRYIGLRLNEIRMNKV